MGFKALGASSAASWNWNKIKPAEISGELNDTYNVYLEPVCPLFLGKQNLQNKAQTPIKTAGSFGFSV